jgi:hypothetical protein
MAQYNAQSVIALHSKAHAAGMAAGGAHTPTPMGVVEADIFGKPKPGAHVEVVHSGVCGFAWVSFKGNTSFGRAMKAAGLARKRYEGGLSVWVSEFGQSMERKEAYARAYAAVLREAGIEAYAGSRMD